MIVNANDKNVAQNVSLEPPRITYGKCVYARARAQEFVADAEKEREQETRDIRVCISTRSSLQGLSNGIL